jgi:flagellar motor component MotA
MKWQPILLICSASTVILAAMSMALHISTFIALAAIVAFFCAGISAFVLKENKWRVQRLLLSESIHF